MDSDLRDKTIKGSFWAFLERVGYLALQFVSNIVLARLLLPEDFGTIGILLVFVTISEVLVDGGFSTSLIQRPSISNVDISTVFYTNLGISIVIYLLLFISAPTVALFFKDEKLDALLKVIEVKVIIDALGSVQLALLRRKMEFHIITKIRIFSIFIAVLISIVLAALGAGVWALVFQNLVFSFLCVVFVWYHSNWRPQAEFSSVSLHNLFGYGSKLMLQQLLSEIYENFQSILIGRHYLASDLGFYTQAKQLQQVPVKSLTNVVTTVSFPAFSRLQGEKLLLKSAVKRNLNVLLFVNTPLMFYLAVLAKPIFVFLYSEKWLHSVPYFQLLCLGFGLFLVIHQSNLSVLKAVGRSDYVLYLEIVKKIFGFALLLIGMYFWGIWGILYGLITNSFLEMFLNGYFVNKEIKYGILEQFYDLFRTVLYSLIPAGVVYFLLGCSIFRSVFVTLLVYTAAFWLLYYCVAKCCKSKSLLDIESILKEYLLSNKHAED